MTIGKKMIILRLFQDSFCIFQISGFLKYLILTFYPYCPDYKDILSHYVNLLGGNAEFIIGD